MYMYVRTVMPPSQFANRSETTAMQADYASPISPYPVSVEGHLGQPSRWLWLFKWLLALPHFLFLMLLWPTFLISSIAAFVAVAFSGRYPRRLFDFNLGVMRWSWRVAFYAYAANGTDLYPPFTLADEPHYPARLQIAYPDRQRRGLALVGWWVAGLPQYLIAGIFMGGGVVGSLAWSGGAFWGGLIGLLVLVAAVSLLVRGSYPLSIFDLVLGLDRWVLRVVAYAAVMTPEYPPFRLDIGGDDRNGPLFATPTVPTTEDHEWRSWGAARIVATALACLTGFLGVVAIIGGGTAVVLDQTQRDASGFLMTSTAPYSTSTYALTSESYDTGVPGDRVIVGDLLGTVRLRAESSRPIFIGIAPADAADRYLAGVAHAEAGSLDARSSDFRERPGGAPLAPPGEESFWAASASGAGTQTLGWNPRPGSWRVVVMNSDGTRDVAADLSVGASAPDLLTIGLAALGIGLLLLLLSGGGLYVVARRAGGAPGTRS
jgi:Domain of unknown function (DUF4389)